jgi:hypothetical protein
VKVGLLQVPKAARRAGRNTPLPNIALMRLSSYHRLRGDQVMLNPTPIDGCDRVYISTLYTWRRREVEGLAAQFRTQADVQIGGSGWELKVRLPAELDTIRNDYDLYGIDYGIGYSSRGCIRHCAHCMVPRAEGLMREEQSIGALLNPRSNKLALLDNNFFASDWRPKIAEIRQRNLIVDWPQGLDIRLMDLEQAWYLGELRRCGQISGEQFTRPRTLHFAWDLPHNQALTEQVVRGVQLLRAVGFKPRDLRFYVLVGYPGYQITEELERIETLHGLEIEPYVMVYRDYGEHDTRDPERVRLRDWNNWHSWRHVPFAEYRHQGSYSRGAAAAARVSEHHQP